MYEEFDEEVEEAEAAEKGTGKEEIKPYLPSSRVAGGEGSSGQAGEKGEPAASFCFLSANML